MRYYRTILVIVALPCLVSMALADNIHDPRIVIGGEGDPPLGVGTNFTFLASSSGGGYYADFGSGRLADGFYNATGSTWTSLGIWIHIPYYQDTGQPILNSEDYTFFDSYDYYNQYFFDTADIFTDVPGWLLILFSISNTESYHGIYGGDFPDYFYIDLRDLDPETGYPVDNGSGGWLGANGSSLGEFNAAGNPTDEWLKAPPVPEPGTLTLLLGGLGLIGIRLIRGKRVSKQG